MNIAVFGATGGTGREIIRQALDAGDHVTAVVRDPAGLPAEASRCRVVTADVTDWEILVPVLAGQDAVISALGPRGRRQAGICGAGTRAILRAMDAARVRRFVLISAAPVGPTAIKDPWLSRAVATPVLRRVLRGVYADLSAAEGAVRRSATDWTIVRPPRLTDRPITGNYRTEIGGNVSGGRSISRADLAAALLKLLKNRATIRSAVGVAY